MSRHRPAYEVSGMNAAGRLQRLRLTDTNGTDADTVEITLTDHDGRLSLPPTGAVVGVSIGWEGALVDRGDYIIDEIEHSGAPDTLTVRGRSANLRQGATKKRTQSWHETTLGDVLNTLAARLNAEPRLSESLAARPVAHLDQTEESDINLLTRLADHHDAVATVKKGVMLFMPKGASVTATGTPIPSVTLSRTSGDRHRYLAADRDAYTGVVSYWQSNQEAERKEVIVGSEENAKRLRRTYATSSEASVAAESEWRRIQRGTASVSLTLADGRADIYPETPIVLAGFKEEIDAMQWVIAQVTHSVSDTAFTTSIECDLSATEPAP